MYFTYCHLFKTIFKFFFQVYLLPQGVEMAQAALAEPLSCLAHGWDIINPVTVGTKVLVIGSGIIGLLWACLLHLHGSRKTITISEPIQARREAVKKLGKNKINNILSSLMINHFHHK